MTPKILIFVSRLYFKIIHNLVFSFINCFHIKFANELKKKKAPFILRNEDTDWMVNHKRVDFKYT
jgi:hypothetical protein